MTDTTPVPPRKLSTGFVLTGVALLVFALAGNYLVLPGYRNFLEHGSRGGGSGGIDFALIWGAARTILWFLSFHLGALVLAYSALLARGEKIRVFRRWFVTGAIVWIVVWMIPTLPGPFTWFFASVGTVILAMIIAVFLRVGRNAARDGAFFSGFRGAEWQIASYFFFALASWDICGLGSVGGILRPDTQASAASHTLVVAQTTKLIVEIALAWGLLALAAFPGRQRPSGA